MSSGQSISPKSVSSVDTAASETDALYKLCFLDLDDTLIPTTWMRNTYDRRTLRVGSLASNLDDSSSQIYRQIKRELDAKVTAAAKMLLQLDDIVIEFLEMLARHYDAIVIVTNARSYTWVATFEKIFDKLAKRMREMGIRIVKTTPREPEPAWASQPREYFEYWSAAKLYEFDQAVKRLTDIHSKLSLACIGDNNFEHCAFLQLCEKYRPQSASIIKCSCGLRPVSFVRQLRVMARYINSEIGVAYSQQPIASLTDGNSKLVVLRAELTDKYIQALTWSYSPRTRQEKDESCKTKSLRALLRTLTMPI